jgi:hypothetical protein
MSWDNTMRTAFRTSTLTVLLSAVAAGRMPGRAW